MRVATITAFVGKVWMSLTVTSLTSLVVADWATTNPQDLADYFPRWKMSLIVESTGATPTGAHYGVQPMTLQAGFLQTDLTKLVDVTGNLTMLDYSNYTDIKYGGKVIYLCCDWDATDPTMIQPDLILNTIMNSTDVPQAIILYSATKPLCYVGGQNFPFNLIWSMISTGDATTLRSIVAGANSSSLKATIMPTARSIQEGQQSHPGNSSAVAMSILYTITGLITLLFLLIITTGAIRAHRNPERYGPRASTNGRPRRSRARGLAMAMLETLPIVKFGEQEERKPDEEIALDNVSGVLNQPHDTTRGPAEGASGHVVAAEPSTETATDANSQHAPEGTDPAAPTGTAPQAPPADEDRPGCSICTEDFTVGEDVRVLPCDHKFHPACVDPWLVNVSGTCPLCRLDLRPPEEAEREEPGNTAAAAESEAAAAAATGTTQATEPTQDPHRRRLSRLLDWNRLRQASVDERLQALRLYRQTQQNSDPASGDDERRHSRLLRRLHIRSDTRSGAATPENAGPAGPSTGEN